VQLLAGVDWLLHDAEYLPEEYEQFARGWGHAMYLDTLRLARMAGVGGLVLWHLDQERTDDDADAIVADARARLAADGSDMRCEMARSGASWTI